MVFLWSLSDGKSSSVSWTLLSILGDLSNAVVRVVLVGQPISYSSIVSTRPLETAPSAPIIIGITVIFTFYNFF